MAECDHCGNPVHRTKAKYCSETCSSRAKHARRAARKKLVHREPRFCAQCGSEIPNTSSSRAKYCSRSCSWTAGNAVKYAARREALGKRPPCPRCGEKIPDSIVRSDAVYCSRLCMTRVVRARNYDPVAAREYNLRYLYGITSEQLARLMAEQDDGCGICGSTEWSGGKPHVDHDHATKLVRGLLCNPCNVGLGLFRDRADLLNAAVAYLTGTPPA